MRRRLLILSAPVVAVALVLAVLLLGPAAMLAGGGRDFRAERYDAAAHGFSSGAWGLGESWRAAFDEGTAQYAGGAAFEATRTLERALALVAPDGGASTDENASEPRERSQPECLVATNLALAYEALGDDSSGAGDADMATRYYERALAQLAGCTSQDREPTDATQEQTDVADSTAARTQAKAQQQVTESEPEEPETTDPEEQESERQRELEQRNRDALVKREQEQGKLGDGGGGGQAW